MLWLKMAPSTKERGMIHQVGDQYSTRGSRKTKYWVLPVVSPKKQQLWDE